MKHHNLVRPQVRLQIQISGSQILDVRVDMVGSDNWRKLLQTIYRTVGQSSIDSMIDQAWDHVDGYLWRSSGDYIVTISYHEGIDY